MAYAEPPFAPWDGRRVPMTFLAGYLGAGKTTLVNEVLATATRPIAVLVNDVGEVNIDAALIARRHGDTIELTDGCVCCSLSEGFAAAIEQIRARPEPPDHIVVELSGIADPNRVLPWATTAGFRLDGVVTVVDVDQLADRLTEPIVATVVEAQLAAADLIVTTKHDLATVEAAAGAERRLAELAPGVPTIAATAGEPGANPAPLAATMLSLGGRDRSGVDATPPPTLFDRHIARTVRFPDPPTLEAIEALLDRLPPTVVRAKGIAGDAADADHGRWLVHVVGRRRTVTPLPEAEAAPATDLVVIEVPLGNT